MDGFGFDVDEEYVSILLNTINFVQIVSNKTQQYPKHYEYSNLKEENDKLWLNKV